MNKITIGIWAGQRLHFTCLTLLLVLVYLGWKFLDRPFPVAYWCAVAFPVIHQVYVWLAWRFELRSSAISGSIGFRGYVAVFFILFAGRFVSLIALAWLDQGSLKLGIVSGLVLTAILAIPGIYAMYSVKRYFGMDRAAGADHFDARFRDMPLVNKGIFRYTSNGMYLYAFLLFWAIAAGFNSIAALAVAGFSHAYIWVHYYATEKPDMDFLYGQSYKRADKTAHGS